MNIERKSGREIAKSNSEVYKQSVDTDLVIQKVLGESMTELFGYKVKVKSVVFAPVINNLGEPVRFKTDNIIIEPELVISTSELLNTSEPLLKFKDKGYTLNQLLGAYGIRKYGEKYNPNDDIYMTPIYYSSRLDIRKVCIRYLLNVKQVDCIDLKLLRSIMVKEPLTSKFGQQDNIDYFALEKDGLPRATFSRYKCLTLEEVRKGLEPVPVCPLLNDGRMASRYCVEVHYIDNNKLNTSIKNLTTISSGENTKLTARREVMRYEIENKFGEIKTFFKYKELVDYIYNLEILPRKFICYVSNIVYNIIKNGEGKIKDYTVRMVVDELKVREWESKHSKSDELFDFIEKYGNVTVKTRCKGKKALDTVFAERANIKRSSSGRFRRSLVNLKHMEGYREKYGIEKTNKNDELAINKVVNKNEKTR